MLFQFIQKASDINHYLKFSDNIRFELISDAENTSNHYKSSITSVKDRKYCKQCAKYYLKKIVKFYSYKDFND